MVISVKCLLIKVDIVYSTTYLIVTCMSAYYLWLDYNCMRCFVEVCVIVCVFLNVVLFHRILG